VARRPPSPAGALTTLGTISGLGEAAVVVLVVALASGPVSKQLPLVGHTPDGVWPRAGLALGVLAVLSAAHLASAWLTARTAADSLETVRRMVVDAYMSADWPTQSRERTGKLQDLLSSGAASIAIGTQQAATALTMVLNLVVVVAAALVVSVWATLGLIAVGCISLLVVRPLRERTRRISEEVVGVSADLATEVTETASLAPELRVSGSLPAARERLSGRIKAARRLFEALRLGGLVMPPAIRDSTIAVVIVGVAVVASRGTSRFPHWAQRCSSSFVH
jgi:ABC-type multidrug transport system fused ATPase/permease subunit